MLGAAALICWTVDTVVLQIGYPPSVSCLTRRSRVRVHALACFLFNIPFLPSAGRSMSPWPCDDVRHVAVSCLIRCLVVMADRESTGKTRVMFRCGSVPLRRRKLSSALPLSFSFPIRHGLSLLILRARKEFFGRALIARLSISQYGYRFFFLEKSSSHLEQSQKFNFEPSIQNWIRCSSSNCQKWTNLALMVGFYFVKIKNIQI